MKWRKDMDEWYPSQTAAVAIHVLGPVHTGGRYIVRVIDELADEATLFGDCVNQSEAKGAFDRAIEQINDLNSGFGRGR